jgi:signal transduction histidine kinase
MTFFRRLNVRLFLSYLIVVIAGGLTVFVTTRLLAPTIFVDELEGLRLRQGQVESPGPGNGEGPGGSGSTLGPGGSEGSGNGPGGPGGDSGPGGTGSTVGPGGSGKGGDGSGGPGGDGGSSGTGSQGADGPNAAGVLLQTDTGTDGATADEDIEQTFLDALDRALLIGLLVSAVVAVLLAAVVSGRIMQPIARIRSAARRLARGHYDERIPLPADTELSELAADFNELAVTLQETEVRRMQLVSEVAHELRTPLTTIQGYMEGLIDEVIEPSEEVYASVAEEAARLQRVAADLSVLSRIEEGAITFKFETVDLSVAAEKVANRLRQQYVDQDVALDLQLDTPLLVAGDTDRLAQVFTNLIGNALGHTPTGGRVVVASLKAGDLARVTVTDTGHGISAEDLGRVFDRFYRAEQDPHSTGTGIGLTIARSIVRSHGGEVTAYSDGPGRGATFVVDLPLADRPYL